jgi:hypothetical protein
LRHHQRHSRILSGKENLLVPAVFRIRLNYL